ncbi:hypothetical protein [Moellerella wisconsensis]|uniref:Uncharacterized protein n=1 Tax=Moellerella wisconsensis TaxID=158849 RepID=A0ACD3Y3V3_9GAMM|nr:hypothetical protein [Moellerella wisconsensis]UNH37797.1 hypothetical protein MNY70_09720 [Moellerella wisconsensis]
MIDKIISTLDNSANLLTCAIVFTTACIATYKARHERKKYKIKTSRVENFSLLMCSLICAAIAITCIVNIAIRSGALGIGLSMIIAYAVVVNAVYIVFGKLEQLDINDNKAGAVTKPKKNKGKKKR